ncbi:4-hydroxy-3-methylbut-2-enyl diphosphate reductase [Blastococcus brunescens]|uniref:4-hydroxy-3-methylbut-2-enyl diphosphate reductase n=1 Tax=Blastococcus brunescens TaxID=1564165 RepID=A0ABZ1B1Y7_9ACTN|nr:4-hydroxy-3-methylbut-2-enyl diphosphate reductase [Blastococcus sp. BMG 8361]WRL64830.1 4-hydroxy-3-methylbut-2-enyl diphosphate reductase [Blastococcus sp. BMG 8361]
MADQRGRVLLADPRGYCAGVDRAVVAVERALEIHGAPVYVRKQIVHNKHVVATLERRGAVFVEETDEVPEGSVVVFSAHGVSPAVHEEAADRQLRTIDATCPLVTKVHQEAKRFARDDFDILLIGHRGHEEVEGTAGEAPAHVQLVDGPEDVANVQVRDPEKVVWLSQTTLSVDETLATVDQLKNRFPGLQSPPSDDICYATQNRQQAVKQMAVDCDLVLVVGSTNSSNSVRLVEVALEAGARDSHLVDFASEIDPAWLEGVATVGVTSGASVPEILVSEVLDWLAERGYADVETVKAAEERLVFALPHELRRAEKAAQATAGTDLSPLDPQPVVPFRSASSSARAGSAGRRVRMVASSGSGVGTGVSAMPRSSNRRAAVSTDRS